MTINRAVEDALEALEINADAARDSGLEYTGRTTQEARATLAAHIAAQDAEIAHRRTQQAAVWRYLQSVSPWSESNDMEWADEIICGIDGLRCVAEQKDAEIARLREALNLCAVCAALEAK